MDLLPLQKYQTKDYSGLVLENNLRELYMQEPEVVNSVIKQIYDVNLHGSMKSWVERFPVKTITQENGFYEWNLKGQDEKNVPLVEAQDIDGNTITSGTLGKGVSSFYLVFDEDIFFNTEVLVGEVEDYHYRVLAKESYGANQIRLRVELVTSNVNLAVPAVELEAGRLFSKDYALTPSTFSYEGSQPYFSSPFRMHNRISMMRGEYKVPGNMIRKGGNEPLKFAFQYMGQAVPVWINYLDMVANYQFEDMFARMMIYGKRNWTDQNTYLNKDANTPYTVESGAGLFEQVAPGNRHKYNYYNLDWHVNLLVDMGVGRIERGRRTITIGTGEFGAIEIHKRIQAEAKQWTIIQMDPGLLRSAGSGNLGSANTFGFGGQWAEYEAYNGVRLKVEIIPFFDDNVRFKTRHPDGNKGLVESHRMLSLDYGGEAGIYRVKVQDLDSEWRFLPGLRDPWTPGGKGRSKLAVSKIDGYEVIYAKWGGLMIEDPTKIVDLQFNFTR